MKRFIQSRTTRLLSMTGALFLVTSSAFAQTSNETGQLLNQLHQLENQVQTLSRAVYRGDKKAMDALRTADESASSTTVANFEVRMSQIEDQQRKLTGDLEKINFELQQIKDKVTRMQVDTDQRFQQQEQSGATTSPTPVAPQPSSPPVTDTSFGTLGENGPAEELYERAFASIRDTKYDQAEKEFRQFLTQYPAHPLASNAHYWLGETFYVRADFKKAAKAFAQGYQDYPKSAKAADSLLKLGLSLSRLGKKDDACLSLRQLQKEFPADTGPLQSKAAQEIKLLGCS